MKTPEEMAEEWCKTHYQQQASVGVKDGTEQAFLAGYKAAKEQLADADKVITYDYVETASNEARELITKFELKNDEDVLVKALVAAYCRGVDAVDGYLRNSLSAYRNSVRRQQWISVKERLPEKGEQVFVVYSGKYCKDVHLSYYENGWSSLVDVTHWMPLPEAPKEEK